MWVMKKYGIGESYGVRNQWQLRRVTMPMAMGTQLFKNNN